jgi:hypothetical protein
MLIILVTGKQPMQQWALKGQTMTVSRRRLGRRADACYVTRCPLRTTVSRPDLLPALGYLDVVGWGGLLQVLSHCTHSS